MTLKDHTHIPVSCLCTQRCGYVHDVSDVYVRGQGWDVDLLIAVSKFARHFLDRKFHHLNIFLYSFMASRCKYNTTSSDGCLGSNNDGGCNEVC